MVSKNDEAQKCANTLGLLSKKSTTGHIDMNNVAKAELNFHGIQLQPVAKLDDIWLTSSDIAKALGYASSKSVSTIYSRNSDEFTSSMSMVIKMMTNGINNNLREKSVRVFSLRGCHLIAMFATTDKAKEFRRWVLDILDREIAHSPIAKQFTDDELQSLCWMWKNTTRMISHIADIEPLLRVAEHRLAPAYYSMSREYCRNTNEVRRLLERETAHVHVNSFTQDNWRVLNNLRIGKIH